jgi:hypothetical protein
MRVLAGTTPFEAGDMLLFESRQVGSLRATATGLGIFGLFLSKDTTPPNVNLSVVGQDFRDGDPVSPEPQFHIVVSDDSGIEPSDIALTLSYNGGEFLPVPSDQKRAHVASGSSQTLIEYLPTLEPGDYILKAAALDLEGHAATGQIQFHVTTSSDLRSALNFPNPFQTYTDLAVEATGEIDTLRITIYSLAGRVVRVLEHPPTAGFVRVRWDGRDSAGRDVANGVYYARVRMTARGKTQSETIKLLKMQ